MLLDRLFRGLPGHPAHPPLTDATIGMFVLATGLTLLGTFDVAPDKLGPAAWLALVGGLLVVAIGLAMIFDLLARLAILAGAGHP